MLKKLVKDQLFHYSSALSDFFNEIYDKRNLYVLIVFLTRRCSNLAEIFYRLRMEESGETLPVSLITDSALFSIVPRLARFYRQRGRFPSILLVDDIVIFGRSLNDLLNGLEERLCDLLEPMGYNRDDVVQALYRAVKIRTFAKSNQPLLLSGHYQANFSADRTMEAVEWRDLSNRISRLILLSGQINSSFICGAEIGTDPGNSAALQEAGFSRIETTYEVFSHATFCRTVSLADGNRIIYTIRLFTSGASGETVAVPFVFFSGLPKDHLNTVLCDTLEACQPGLGNALRNGIWSGCIRAQAEAFTLLLSASLLREFCRMTGSIPKFIGRTKLQMNFGTAFSYNVEQFIDLMLNPGAKLLSLKQMDWLFRYMSGGDSMNRVYQFSTPSAESGNKKLRLCMENYIYKKGLESYSDHYWKTRTYQNSSQKEAGDAPEPVMSMLDWFTADGAAEYPLSHKVSWLLQMADAGIVGITVRRSGRYVEQCIKTGEQSQFIMSKRLRDYIPVLILIQSKARILNRDFDQELRAFAHYNQDMRQNLKRIQMLLKGFRDSGQKVEDWGFDLNVLPDAHSPDWDAGMAAVLESVQHQRKLVDDYAEMVRAAWNEDSVF